MSDTFSPPIFKKFAKNINDLVKQKFNYSNQVKFRNSTSNGIQFTTTGVAKDGDFTGSLNTQYKNADFGLVKADLQSSGATEVTVEADKLSKGLLVRLIGTDALKSNVDVEYTKDAFAGTLNWEADKSKTVIAASGAVGFDGVAAGAEVKYDAKVSAISDYNAAVEYQQADFVGTLKTREKADKVDLYLWNRVNADLQSGAFGTYAFLARTWSIGGLISHRLDNNANIKVKADTTGIVAAVLEQRLASPNALIRFSTEFNAKKASTTPEKFGVSLFFGEGYTDKD